MRNKKNKQISDEMISCYVDGLLSDKEKAVIEKLILEDSELKEAIEIQRIVAKEQKEEDLSFVPINATERAKNLVSEEFGVNVLELVVNFAENFFEGLRSTGEVIIGTKLQPAYAMRGEEKEKAKTLIVSKNFNNIRIEIELTREMNDKNTIIFKAKDNQTELASEDLRATILEEETELESHITQNGKAIFEGVKPGKYKIEISNPDEILGMISLQLFKV